jgi:hypothetical protein
MTTWRSHMDEQQLAIKKLVEQMLAAAGLDATNLAKLAGLAPSTLNRFLNQQVKHTLSVRTLGKLLAVPNVAGAFGKWSHPFGPLASRLDQERTDLLAAYDAMDEEQRRAMLVLAKGAARRDASSRDSATAAPDLSRTVAPGKVQETPNPPHPTPEETVQNPADGVCRRVLRLPMQGRAGGTR